MSRKLYSHKKKLQMATKGNLVVHMQVLIQQGTYACD